MDVSGDVILESVEYQYSVVFGGIFILSECVKNGLDAYAGGIED